MVKIQIPIEEARPFQKDQSRDMQSIDNYLTPLEVSPDFSVF